METIGIATITFALNVFSKQIWFLSVFVHSRCWAARRLCLHLNLCPHLCLCLPLRPCRCVCVGVNVFVIASFWLPDLQRDRTRQDKDQTRQDRTREDKTRQGKKRHDKTRQGNRTPDMIRLVATRREKTEETNRKC